MPGKRPRSPSPAGPSSRVDDTAKRTRVEAAPPTLQSITGRQEIFLRILGFLSPNDLVQVQGVNRYWASMSLDPQLWKRLYLSRYPHPHHSKLIYRNSPTPSRSQRPLARLPSRAFPPPSPRRSPSLRDANSPGGAETPQRAPKGHAVPLPARLVEAATEDEIGSGVRNDGVDWKMMLRLGTNWANGNVASSSSVSLPPSPSPSIAQHEPPSTPRGPPPYSEQHIALFPSFIFTSNPTSPLVHVHPSTGATGSVLGIIPPPPGWSSPHRPDNITAICADQAVSTAEDPDGELKPALPARLAIFYSSGGFVIVRVRLSPGSSRIGWNREMIHPPSTRPKSLKRRATSYTLLEGDPVVLAAMHYPVLLTCTLAFHLSVHTLSESTSAETPSRPRHLSTMHSDVSFHPAALSLLPLPSLCGAPPTPPAEDPSSSFRAGLTYCTPLYPSSWTVAVQEFGIDLERPDDTGGHGGEVWRGECYHVGPSLADVGEDEHEWPKRVKPIVGVKASRAVGIGTDGRWCVLAGGDNQIQVYSLPTPSPSPPPGRVPGKDDDTLPILHSQTLLAHYGDVTSLSLSSGRCVSGGRDGRVLVWNLDEDEEDERPGRTVGYVEVRPGGRREWHSAAGPRPLAEDIDGELGDVEEGSGWELPHPQSISSAARSLFLARPPPSKRTLDEDRPAIRHLAFDEEKIVGLVREGDGEGEVMKVWSFNG